jgi:hypothetical protein
LNNATPGKIKGSCAIKGIGMLAFCLGRNQQLSVDKQPQSIRSTGQTGSHRSQRI